MALLRISGKNEPVQHNQSNRWEGHDHKYAEIQAIGRSAVRHAEKAIARAKAVLKEEDIHIVSEARIIKSGVDEKEGFRTIIN